MYYLLRVHLFRLVTKPRTWNTPTTFSISWVEGESSELSLPYKHDATSQPITSSTEPLRPVGGGGPEEWSRVVNLQAFTKQSSLRKEGYLPTCVVLWYKIPKKVCPRVFAAACVSDDHSK